MKETLLYLGIIFTILFTVAYFVILFFFPEWVGISGKDSQKTLESHQDEQKKED